MRLKATPLHIDDWLRYSPRNRTPRKPRDASQLHKTFSSRDISSLSATPPLRANPTARCNLQLQEGKQDSQLTCISLIGHRSSRSTCYEYPPRLSPASTHQSRLGTQIYYELQLRSTALYLDYGYRSGNPPRTPADSAM